MNNYFLSYLKKFITKRKIINIFHFNNLIHEIRNIYKNNLSLSQNN